MYKALSRQLVVFKVDMVLSFHRGRSYSVVCFWQENATWSRGDKTWVQSQTQNKVQWLAACGTRVHNQPIIALYFEIDIELKFL